MNLMKSKMNSDIQWLEKNIKRYKFDEIYKFTIYCSTKILREEFNGNGLKNIIVYPWNINTLTLMKIYLGENRTDYGELTKKKFMKFVRIIQDLETHSNNFDFLDMLSKLLVNQTGSQLDNSILLYRCNYIYNFKNKDIDMSAEFAKTINYSSESVCSLFYSMYLLFGNSDKSDINANYIFNKIYFSQKYSGIFKMYTIDYNEIEEIVAESYTKFDQISLGNIHLNPYVFLKKNQKVYVTYPHNFLSSYYYGTYFRILNSNPKLRDKLGKIVWEEYLYHILFSSSKFDEVSKQKEYKKSKSLIKTSDVLAYVGNSSFFFEMKSTTVSKKLRDHENVHSVNEKIKVEAKKINQVYKQMKNYKDKLFCIGEEAEIDNIYGIVVNIENSYIDRREIFENFFEIHLPNADEDEMKYIYDSIRIVDLYNLEHIFLINHNKSMKEILFGKPYTNFYFSPGSSAKEKRTEHLQRYIDEHKRRAKLYFREIIGFVNNI